MNDYQIGKVVGVRGGEIFVALIASVLKRRVY